MTTPHQTRFRSPKEMLDALATARGSARVRMHLLSMEARERWTELESHLDRLQSRIELDGDKATQTAAGRLHELTQSVRELLSDPGEGADLRIAARELMKPVRTCTADNKLTAAAQLMWELDCGSVVVVDAGGKLLGVITDRDICMAAYTRGELLSNITIESVMVKEVTCARPADSLEEILRLMRDKQIRRIPVVEGERLVGIVTLADVARYVETKAGFGTATAAELAHTLAAISTPRRMGAAAQ